MLNDQKDKLFNSLEVPNRTNQFQTQIMIERGNPFLEPMERDNPLLELTQVPRKVEEKRPVPRRSKHVLFMKKLSKTIERGNPKLNQEQPKHVPHKAEASTLETKQVVIELGNPL